MKGFPKKLSKIHPSVLLWIFGFVVLFIINAAVELILLPLWGLDNTEKNDIYFKIWWIVVGIWFLFGKKILKFIERKLSRK